MDLFKPTRQLLNAKFEGYKLSLLEDAVISCPLPHNSTAAANAFGHSSNHAVTGWKDARSKAKWNHLAVSQDDGTLAWIDTEGTLWTANLDNSENPHFTALASIPLPLSSQNSLHHAPHLLSLPQGKWIATDGAGVLYYYMPSGEITNAFLSVEGNIVPFRLHSVSETCAIISTGTGSSKTTTYNVHCVQLPPTSNQLHLLWTVEGKDIPVYAHLTETSCCLGSSSAYGICGAPPTHSPTPEPMSDIDTEPAPVPRAPQPYSWTQSSDTISLAFALPSDTSASQIKVNFSPQTLSVFTPISAIPSLSAKKLWGRIDSSSSTWTWEHTDSSATSGYGLLSVHLEKANDGTKWPQLFQDDDGVSEAVDPSELAKITENLAKYTSELQEQPLGAGSSLISDEIDVEVDGMLGEEGRGIVFTWVWQGEDGLLKVQTQQGMNDLVSLPLPQNSAQTSSVIIKYDVDGLLFDTPNTPETTWTHTSTYPALSFVVASKKDVTRTFHLSDRLCIALETGSPLSNPHSGGLSSRSNGYLYYAPPPGSKVEKAKSAVISVAGPESGIVLGAAAIEKDGNFNLIILCEKELRMTPDVFR